jgi:O-antigen/teichoic acid export membrane protein
VNRKSSNSEDHPEQRTGLARHAAINLLGGIFTPAASFASGPILAHALSVEGRGELAAATMPLALTVTVATIGLPEAVIYFVAQDRRRTKMLAKRGALLILFPAAIATAILILVSPWISGGNSTVHRLIVASAALVAPSLLLSIIRAVAAAHNRWTAITIERIITATTKLIPLIVLFAIGELGLVAASIVTVASTLTGAVAYIPLLALRQSDSGLGVITNTEVMSFGSGVWVGSISGILLMRIDQVLLSPLSGAIQLGIYAVAVSISELPLIVNTAIRETAFTHLSDRGVRPGEVGDLSRFSTIIVAALCLPVGALSPILIPFLFGSDFSGAVPVLLILLLAVCLGNPGSIAGVGLSSSGYPHLRSFALFAACFVNVALVFLLAPSLGATAAAVAALLGNVIASNLCIAWMVARRGASLGDYYRFRSSDFVKVSRLLCRGFRRLMRKAEAR